MHRTIHQPLFLQEIHHLLSPAPFILPPSFPPTTFSLPHPSYSSLLLLSFSISLSLLFSPSVIVYSQGFLEVSISSLRNLLPTPCHPPLSRFLYLSWSPPPLSSGPCLPVPPPFLSTNFLFPLFLSPSPAHLAHCSPWQVFSQLPVFSQGSPVLMHTRAASQGPAWLVHFLKGRPSL